MFKNKKFEVKMVKDSEEPAEMSKPHFDRLDIEMLSQYIIEGVVAGYIVIKSVKTLCSIAEHVVVTKVK